MSVRNFTICRGITGAARQLGVSYNHLWKVLTGSYDSPSLVLKINRLMPDLFRSCLCKIKYRSIINSAKTQYYWDEEDGRYYKIPTTKGKR